MVGPPRCEWWVVATLVNMYVQAAIWPAAPRQCLCTLTATIHYVLRNSTLYVICWLYARGKLFVLCHLSFLSHDCSKEFFEMSNWFYRWEIIFTCVLDILWKYINKSLIWWLKYSVILWFYNTNFHVSVFKTRSGIKIFKKQFKK